jgi:hypothetical protein
MWELVKFGDGLTVRVSCCICCQPMRLDTAWVGFVPPEHSGEAAEGRWLHKSCVDGGVERVFGSPHVTLMRGFEVVTRLVKQWRQS